MSSRRNVGRHDLRVSRVTRRVLLQTAGAAGSVVALGAREFPVVLAQEATPAAGDYPEVVVVAAEYRFEMPASTPGGLTRLTMRNEGAEDHHAMFMRVNDGSTLEDLQAALETPDLGAIFAVSTSLGGPEVSPGGEASVIADLEPGRYMVICVIPDAEGVPHYLMGMQAPLEVGEVEGTQAPPEADMTVELVDFAFVMPEMDVAPGQHVWEVPNIGEQIHEMVILQLAEGVTPDQVQAIFQAPPATPGAGGATPVAMPEMAGPPPFTVIGGVAPMSPGYTNWAILDLEAGDYIAICFVPDPATGAPHFALGMIMPFTVE